MLFITHDFGVVADIADDVMVMFRGEIVEAGTKKQVLSKTRNFISVNISANSTKALAS